MKPVDEQVMSAIHRIAQEFPGDHCEAFLGALGASQPGDWRGLRKNVTEAIAIQPYQQMAMVLLDRWRNLAPEMSPDSLCTGLNAAAYSIQKLQTSPSVELVWTGPLGGTANFRRTEQALLELIHHARKRLLIVTFAAYKATLIQEAIGSALRRGVVIRFIGESTLESGGKVAFNAFSAFNASDGNGVEVFIWPHQQREVDGEGKSGSLHVKCAVADEEYLLLSSANMTEYAMSLNMEMGVLIKGGSLPRQVVQHFDRLIQCGILKSV